MRLPDLQDDAALEWLVAQQAVEDQLNKSEVVEAFKPCRAIEVYTDGSAPITNPGGPLGFAAVEVGYAEPINVSGQDRPGPCARLEVGGFVAARTSEPKTSNNRAEIAAVLAAFDLVRKLGEHEVAPRQVYVWSDSSYTVNCGTGKWQRKKNTDLWTAYDAALKSAEQATGASIKLGWVKGHASNQYNGAADELATLAAFNFDEVAHRRFRAAQIATGREIPGEKLLAQHGATLESKASDAPAPDGSTDSSKATALYEWLPDTDYAVLLLTQMEGGGQPGAGSGPCTGTYRLTTSKGHSHQTRVKHRGNHLPDEGEYLTLLSALDDLAGRIRTAGRDPGKFTLTIFSGRELMAKQLTGAYQVKSPLLKPLYERTRGLLGQFSRAEIVMKPSAVLKNELR